MMSEEYLQRESELQVGSLKRALQVAKQKERYVQASPRFTKGDRLREKSVEGS